MAKLTIEHIVPRSAFAIDDPRMHAEEDLWLACHICNGHKSDKAHEIDPETGQRVPLFNPRNQSWYDHFQWSADGIRIIGITPTRRATVIALQLDSDPEALAARANWVSVGWHPPKT
jgi:hypothetical protein